MPKNSGPISRQQQEQERILLSQTPTWLATPQPRASHGNPGQLRSNPQSPTLAQAKCDFSTSASHPSLLRRVADGHSSTPPPGGRSPYVGSAAIGARVAAGSPFPVARTPPPRLPTNAEASPLPTLAGTASPLRDGAPAQQAAQQRPRRRPPSAGGRPSGGPATSEPAADGPVGELVVAGNSSAVVMGKPPAMQGLHAIVAGNIPRGKGKPNASPGPVAGRRAARPAALSPIIATGGGGVPPASGPTSPSARLSSPLSPARSIMTPGGSAVNMLLSAQQPPPSAGGMGWDPNGTFFFAPRTPATTAGGGSKSAMGAGRSSLVTPQFTGARPPPTPFDTGATARGDLHGTGAGGGSQVKVTVIDSSDLHGSGSAGHGGFPGSGGGDSSYAGGTSPRGPQGFHVPDLSDMDPFTLMERGLAEEVAHFRADPKAYTESVVAPRIVVSLPPLPPVQEVPAAPPSPQLHHLHQDSPSGHSAVGSPDSPHASGGPSPSQVSAALKPTAGRLHPALVPPCFADLTASARAVRRAQRAHDDERTQIVHREEVGFGAKMPDVELLGGFYTALGPHHRGEDSHARLVVPLGEADAFLYGLQKALADLRSGANMASSGNDAAGAAAPAAKKKAGGKGAVEPPPSVANAMKPTPQHRKIAVEVITKLIDECTPVVADLHARTRPSMHIHHDHEEDGGITTGTGGAASSSPTSRVQSPESNAQTPAAGKDGGSGSSWGTGSTVSYVKGMCMAARDLATLLSNAAAVGAIDIDHGAAASPTRGRGNQHKPPTLTTVDLIASQYGKVMEPVHAYVIYGLWHQPHTAVSELVLRWLHNRCHSHPPSVPTASRAPVYIGHSADTVLLNRAKLMVGAGWQRHSTKGAVTVVLLSTGFQEISYIKQHRNLPVVELRRCFNQGQMAKEERVYSLTYIPDHYEIRAVRPVVHPVECGRRVEVTVEVPAHVLLSCTVEVGAQDKVPGRSQNTTLIDRVGRLARLHVILYEQVPSRLVVFARHPADLNYRRSSTVLLRPSAAQWDADEGTGADGSEGSSGREGTAREAASRRSMMSRGVSRAGRVGTAGNTPLVADSLPTVFPEQFEVFQGLLGHLLCPRHGELLDAATASQDCPALEVAEAAASQHLPHGVQLGEPARKALHGGGTLFSFRASADAQEAIVTGAHGSVKLHRVLVWRSGARYDLRPRAGNNSAKPDTAWFFGVAKLKQGSPVTLWVNGQCGLQWILPH